MKSSAFKNLQLVILDRDGVINFDSPDYILSPEQWRPIPGSLEAIAKLKQAGLLVSVCSNQSGLGRGMMNQSTFEAIQAKMVSQTEKADGAFDDIAYCPHHPDDGCSCRKPLPGMLLDTMKKLNIEDTSAAVMVGDSYRDVQAADAAGIPAILVRSGYGDADEILKKSRVLMPNIQQVADLAVAANMILQGGAINS
jgi:D-glycero-D-manno-heptose 1,7-bisphosphate phosphatase